MRREGPPARYRGTPHACTINVGERFWRVHSRRYAATEFNPEYSGEHFGGGRFDGTKVNPYPYYYAAAEQSTALAEVFLRDEIGFNPLGYRVLPRRAIAMRRVSAVETVRLLTLISLRSGPDLAAAAVNTWLVQGGTSYGESRAVAHWLRDRAPWAEGMIWTSTIDLGKPAVVLFGDRCGSDSLREVPRHAVDLDDEDGVTWLNAALAPYRTVVRLPRRSL
jgi:hypothetical protein